MKNHLIEQVAIELVFYNFPTYEKKQVDIKLFIHKNFKRVEKYYV